VQIADHQNLSNVKRFELMPAYWHVK
jgi:hypothetical protein